MSMDRCEAPDGSIIPCSKQSCDYERYGGQWVARLLQGALDDDYPYPCRPGVYGSSLAPEEQSSGQCSGDCWEGYFCLDLATIVPVLTPPGSYSLKGATAPTSCGPGTYTRSNISLFSGLAACKTCPAWTRCDSPKPVTVRKGWYWLANSNLWSTSEFAPCHLLKACVGGTISGPPNCAHGSTEICCGGCLPRFYHGPGSCSPG